MVSQIVDEITRCLENECYLAALALALTLPDVCGKAEYPEKGTQARYIDWYQNNIGCYEKLRSKSDKEELADLPYLSGEFLYKLRCSFLHSGDTNVDFQSVQEEQNKLTHFSLVIRRPDDLLSSFSSAKLSYNMYGEVEEREFEVSIVRICKILSAVALKYYRENHKKFNFFSYNIIDQRESVI